jgi:hypothetical protein
MLLPTTRHVRELIEHSEEHLSLGSEKDLKIALIHVDNSIEIMLKEYLRYQKEKKLDEIEDISFYGLLNMCPDISVVKSSKSLFIAFHDMRNAIYHLGNLLPPKKDVESAIELAKSLFNELHPQDEFKNVEVTLPSNESIKMLNDAIGNKPYITEISAIQNFSACMMSKGYGIQIEHAMGGEIRYRADLIARKGDKVIVCEFKRSPNRYMMFSAMEQLKTYLSLAKTEFSNKQVEGWLIFYGRKVLPTEKKTAKASGLKLLDEKDLELFYRGSIEFE